MIKLFLLIGSTISCEAGDVDYLHTFAGWIIKTIYYILAAAKGPWLIKIDTDPFLSRKYER